jgi:L-amino acid N-acyltransferase
MTAPQIRLAADSDLETINDIYNYYVSHSTCTYQEQPETLEGRRQWFAEHSDKYPVTVAQADDQILGWGSLSRFRPRSAFRNTVENAIYIRHDLHRRGIGSLILQDLIDRARAIGYHAIIAGVDGEQAASLALHAKFGFQMVARLKEVGFKFDRWLDVIYMELLLA